MEIVFKTHLKHNPFAPDLSFMLNMSLKSEGGDFRTEANLLFHNDGSTTTALLVMPSCDGPTGRTQIKLRPIVPLSEKTFKLSM